MLQGHNEWRQVQDIVKLTLKALCDVVRSQGIALREVERQLPTLCTKNDVELQLTEKADFAEVQTALADIEN